jgi:hypothetical protein
VPGRRFPRYPIQRYVPPDADERLRAMAEAEYRRREAEAQRQEVERQRWETEHSPETYQRRVLAFVAEHPEGVSSQAIRAGVHGGSQAVDDARRVLVEVGAIRRIRWQGGGRFVAG